MGKKKDKLPKTLIAVNLDDGEGGGIMVVSKPDEICEDFHGDIVGVYQLVSTGTFNVEKSISTKKAKR
jgi:hypothetical protein